MVQFVSKSHYKYWCYTKWCNLSVKHTINIGAIQNGAICQ